ncbi:uncharacterized protein [Panulirus ornatus]|uniref:uncharacterized protein n=1 Tax=Panulirus ornatus TaxID=150431 RepID=UPI003A862B8B
MAFLSRYKKQRATGDSIAVLVLVVAAGVTGGQEGTVLVTSIPWVTSRLQNPCHLLNQQQDPLEDDPRDPNVTLEELREVTLSNILFLNATLLSFQQNLNNECNMPFSLLTLPSPPTPVEDQEQQEALRQMHRQFLYVASHFYFVINNTDPVHTMCNHETQDYLDRLNRLAGMLENLLCRLVMVVESEEEVASSVEEVSGLRLMQEASCGGRGLWVCILISHTKRSLLTLRNLMLLQHQHQNVSTALNNDITEVTSQSKRFLSRDGAPASRLEGHLGLRVAHPDGHLSSTVAHPGGHISSTEPRPEGHLGSTAHSPKGHFWSIASLPESHLGYHLLHRTSSAALLALQHYLTLQYQSHRRRPTNALDSSSNSRETSGYTIVHWFSSNPNFPGSTPVFFNTRGGSASAPGLYNI